jgi:spermidine synthase
MSRGQRLALRVAVFSAGALLMALEVAAFRIIGKTFGSALRETTTVIAVFLAAMSAGYWAGGRAGDRWPRATTLVATLIAAATVLLCVPWLDAWLSPRIAESGLALATHAFAATTVLFAIPTFLLAATSPIAVRLFTTGATDSGSTAGSISAISTAGSIAGSLATAFFLIDWLESIARTVLFVAAGAAATAMVVILATGATRTRRLAMSAAGAALLLVLGSAFFRSATAIEGALMQPLPGTKVVFVGDSPYHRVTVLDRGPVRELKFNIGVQTRMRLRDPYGPGLMYSDAAHISRLLRPHARRMLILGLGGATIPKQFIRSYPDVIVDAVEVDPMVVQVAKKYFALEDSDRLRIHVSDARTFVRRSSATWDLIIVDVASTNRYGDTMPPHLVTREFFEELTGHLAADGIVHFHCAFHQSKLWPALHKTMGSVFPSVIHTQGEVFASRVALIPRQDVLLARLDASPAKHLPNIRMQIAALTSDPVPANDVPLLTDDYAPADTLLRTRR